MTPHLTKDIETFYREINKVLTKNLGWQTGHNLDAFTDLLRGGFGVYEIGEQIKHWPCENGR